MSFLPVTGLAFRVATVCGILMVIWIVWGSYAMPEALWAPGNLSRHHQNLSSCLACHQPFKGATSGKCGACHQSRFLADTAKPEVREVHLRIFYKGGSCLFCHSEHKGRLAPITVGALANPHGDFVFIATGTKSCNACHDFSDKTKSGSHLRDNITVKRLLREGEGTHKLGRNGKL